MPPKAVKKDPSKSIEEKSVKPKAALTTKAVKSSKSSTDNKKKRRTKRKESYIHLICTKC